MSYLGSASASYSTPSPSGDWSTGTKDGGAVSASASGGSWWSQGVDLLKSAAGSYTDIQKQRTLAAQAAAQKAQANSASRVAKSSATRSTMLVVGAGIAVVGLVSILAMSRKKKG